MFARRGYLLDVTMRVPNRRTLTELVDVLVRYRYNELLVYGALPKEEDEFDLGRLDAYCQLQDIALRRVDEDAWRDIVAGGDAVAVATESALSLAGRVEEMRERMQSAESSARLRGASAFYVTDFSDGYQWHPFAVSLPGIVLGGNFASAGGKSAKMDIEHELDSVMDAPLGSMLLELGTLYLCGGARRADSSEFFNILANDHGYSRHPGITQRVLDEVGGVAHGIMIAAERWADACRYAKEISYAARLLDCACHRRDETRLRELRVVHGQVWRQRYTESGRVESLSRLPRF